MHQTTKETMGFMSTETKEAAGKKADRAESYTLLFEMENVATGGRKAAYESARKAVESAGGKLTPSLFARYALDPNPQAYAETLLQAAGAGSASVDAFCDAVRNGVAEYLHDRSELNAGLGKLVDAALGLNMAVGVVSSMPEEGSGQVLSRLGLADKVKVFQVKDLEKGYPRADSWLKACKQFGRNGRNAIVVASCMTACKSALSAGMRSIVVTDEFTSHQDFSGADIVLDSWDEMSAKEILGALVPAE
jgi:beta-phosphoglucomutase-like phosphatase (HAD superfamily)